MLVNFIFSNFRSYREECLLSMQATQDVSYESSNCFEVPASLLGKKENKLLKSAVIFGSNASGKSNLIKAIKYMQKVISSSKSQDNGIACVELENFVLCVDSIDTPSSFEIDLIIDNVYYEYGFSILNNLIVKEFLYRRESGKTARLSKIITLFERENNSIIKGIYAKTINEKVAIDSLILLLTVGKGIKEDFAIEFFKVVQSIMSIKAEIDSKIDKMNFSNLDKYREIALKILEKSDIGINGISVEDEILDESLDNFIKNKSTIIKDSITNKNNRNMIIGVAKDNSVHSIDIMTKFNIYNNNREVVDSFDVKLLGDRGFNSQGTEKLINILGVILGALNEGQTIILDEIDANLHYKVAKYIIDLFNSSTNRSNAQLIVTAHNPLLMENKLRKDQIYFVEKNEYNESSLSSLAEFINVKKEHSVFRRYLAGYFNAIPKIDIDTMEEFNFEKKC